MRQVRQIMGMPITVDVPECDDKNVFEAVFTRLHEIDDRFSPYKENSELTKWQKNKVSEDSLTEEFREVMEACEKAEEETDGYFSAYFNGKFDPTGYVKGWAIAESGKLIRRAGFNTYCIGAGGDILARSNKSKEWKIGIENPKVNKEILNKLSIYNGAVATSGSYKRGTHIINPFTGDPAKELTSVTVVGPDITTADVFATAVFAGGIGAIVMVEEKSGYETLTTTENGDIYMTSGMEKLLS